MLFKETSVFTRRLASILDDDEYRELQVDLVKKPDAGKEIKQSGGIRKLRWSAKGRGKRGGCRIIYYWIISKEQILFLYVYGKNEQEDLTADQIKALKRVVELELKGV